MNPRSLVFRLGAWYTLLLGSIFVLVAAATFYGLQHYLRTSLRDSLSRRSEQVEEIVRNAPAASSDNVIGSEIETRVAPEFNNRFVRVTRSTGSVIYRSGPPADRSFDPSMVAPGKEQEQTGLDAHTAIIRAQRLMVRKILVRNDSGIYVVEVGVSTASMEDVLNRLLDLLALLLPVLIVCAAAGGYWLVSWALRPVDRLSATAEQMSLQNLTLRVPVSTSGDALERLSIALNNMLGRLRDSVQASRRFLADASHELRTPLAVIKGELQELTRESTLSKDDIRERAGSVLEEVARLEHLVSGLLVLSRLDAGDTQLAWVEVDLGELARNTAEQMRLMAEDGRIEMDPSESRRAMVLGDRHRLKQIIVNLLDNAIRFTAPGGVVRIRTETNVEGSLLEISDTGIGIPASAIPQVFDRFYRVDQARSRDDGGAGLGLSIVKSICTAHGAEIALSSEVGSGSCFRIWFPRQSVHPTAIAAVPQDEVSPRRAEALSRLQADVDPVR